MKKITKNWVIWFAAGLLIGFGLLAGWRFGTYSVDEVHYHANFAFYLDGKRVLFKDPTFYEDEAPCSEEEADDPRHHAHLHDEKEDVIHVHEHGVTWGQFFENIGFSIGKYHVQTREHVYTPSGSEHITFVLNDKKITDPSNVVIHSEDKLLVSYGHQPHAKIMHEYESISGSARQFNQSDDPATCGSNAPTDWKQRLKSIFN